MEWDFLKCDDEVLQRSSAQFHDVEYNQAEVVPYQIKVYDRGSRTPFLKLHCDERLTRIKPQPFHQDPKAEYYNMTASKHGLALIFNNETFKCHERHEQRVGTARDEENIMRTCYYLGYCPIVFRQFSRREVIDLFEDLDSLIEHFDNEMANDSFLCFFLSHGKEGEIVASDSKNIPIKRIERLAGESKKLSSKPKIFFIQACQGSTMAEAIQDPFVREDGDGYRAKRSDIYIFYASVSGETAYRNEVTGTWFVTAVCLTLCEFAMCKNVFDLQLKLNKRMSRNDSNNTDYRCKISEKLYAQQTTGGHQLERRVHFFFNEK